MFERIRRSIGLVRAPASAHAHDARGNGGGAGPLRALSGAGPQREFRLLRYFTSTSVAAFLIVAAALGYVFRELSIDGLIDGYENEHVNLTTVMANELWDNDLGPLVRSLRGMPPDAVRNAPELPAVHRRVLALLKGTTTFKVKVYDVNGMTIYSTELAQIGEDKSMNAGVQSALRGLNRSELVHRDTFSTFEREVQNRDLVQSYVPRYDPVTGAVDGVFELYTDATSVLAEIGEKQTFVVAVVVGMMTILYLALFLIVNRANELLAKQDRERLRAQQTLRAAEERWSFALEGALEGVWDRNMKTGEVVYSKRYREIYGYSDKELSSAIEDWEGRVHPDDLPRVRASRRAYFEGRTQVYVNERRMRCRDGTYKWIHARGMVVSRDANGAPLRMIGTHRDITEEHERAESLRLAATVFDTVDEAVMVTDHRNRIIAVNPAFVATTGYPRDEVIGRNPRLLAGGAQPPGFLEQLWTTLLATGSWQGELRTRRRNGEIYVAWLSVKVVRDELGALSHFVGVFSDISEQKLAEDHLRRLAHHDVLTGLPNRTLFIDRLRQAVAERKRDRAHAAVMFLDLDKFKAVNDTAGHEVGDRLLKEVAARIQVCVRESDTVSRIGGDEFVVLLPSVADETDAMDIARRICYSLEQPFAIAGQAHCVSASVGVATWPEHGGDETQLFRNADVAMYRAKAAGGNTACPYRDETEALGV